MRDLVLYRFFDSNGLLLYIGKSVSAWSRTHSHQGSAFYEDAATMTLQRGFVSHDDLIAAEVAAIHAERPVFNVAHARSGEDSSLIRLSCRALDLARFAELHPDLMPEFESQMRACVDSLVGMAECSVEVDSRPKRRLKRRVYGVQGRPRVLSGAQADQVLRLYAAGESVADLARLFKVGRDTVYRAIRAAQDEEGGE